MLAAEESAVEREVARASLFNTRVRCAQLKSKGLHSTMDIMDWPSSTIVSESIPELCRVSECHW